MCSRHVLIMPEVLFLEMLTTKSENMVKCFRKFPEIENPVSLVPNVGSLIRFETENNIPCSPIETQFIKIHFVFNSRLVESGFNFTEEQKASLLRWQEEVKEGTKGFIEKAIVSDGWFPALSDWKPGKPSKPIADAMNLVATDDHFIKNIYSELRDEIYATYKAPWPEPKKINQNWILFRYLQVHLLAALEYIRRYGRDSQPPERLENEFLDIDYCIIGTICSGLATRDATMAKFYRLLCPDKDIIS